MCKKINVFLIFYIYKIIKKCCIKDYVSATSQCFCASSGFLHSTLFRVSTIKDKSFFLTFFAIF